MTCVSVLIQGYQDFATIAYSVPHYYEAPSPAINLDENLNVAKGKKLHYMYVYYVIHSLTNVTQLSESVLGPINTSASNIHLETTIVYLEL